MEPSKEMCASGGRCEGVCRTLYRTVSDRAGKDGKLTGATRLCTAAYIKTSARKKHKLREEEDTRKQQLGSEQERFKGLFDY